MKRILFLLVSLIAILAISCTKDEMITPKPQIFDATCQKWYGGQEESGRGSLYFIYLKTASINYQKLRTDSLYTIDSREFGDTTIICLKTHTTPLYRFGVLYYNNDSVEIHFNIIPEVNYP